MLVLTRKTDEQIIIDGNIRVTVVAIRGNRVQIGVEAPPEISVRRSELPSNTKDAETRPGCDTLFGAWFARYVC